MIGPFPKVAAFSLCDRPGGREKQFQAYFPPDEKLGRTKDFILVPHSFSPVRGIQQGVNYDVAFCQFIGSRSGTSIILVMVEKVAEASEDLVTPTSPRSTRSQSRKPYWVAPRLTTLMKPHRPFVVLDHSGPTKVRIRPARRVQK